MCAQPAAPPALLHDPPRLLLLGDAALTVEFAAAWSPEAAARVRRLAARVAVLAAAEEGIREYVPTLRSVTIHVDPSRLSLRRLQAMLRDLPEGAEATAGEATEWCLPVRYGGEQGPDLPEIASTLGMAEDEVAELHTAGHYEAAAVGGYPGFAYLTGVDGRLALPRRASPRLSVPEGSVAVANGFTGVYPATAPGGWHLLGRTPVPLFAPDRPGRPALVMPGDTVRFRAISPEEFEGLWSAFRDGRADPVTACRAP
ncbi:5-oxoprolinase subunit PxpB [Sabulicella rubraurantiaca]|uniref:5-oxoprolinase subunit PxpB n=1 Tax=Sabulicella rubraurantiaca TaxID=2811429 RepID=UPI001A97962E|nr:5-oxoprolinase subunit PxpB [Sabulicella rubraurantiaca]